MLDAFLIGAAAGYAIAVPVGPTAVLILQIGMRDGLRGAAAAGAGAATVDLIYATLAMIAGPTLVAAIAPIVTPARVVAGLVLVFLAIRNLLHARAASEERAPAGAGRSYATVLVFTLLNPITITYFATLAIGLPELAGDPAARLLFVLGAAIASLSWQWILAAVGASLRGRVPERFGIATTLFGTVIMLGFALRILTQALS